MTHSGELHQTADAALEKALMQREALKVRAEGLASQVRALASEWDRAREQLQEIEGFIRMWHQLAGTEEPESQRQTIQSRSLDQVKRVRSVNPPREFVAKACAAFIVEAGRPLSRIELFQSLSRDGIEIRGKHPEMVLSTMLWRSEDTITRIKGGGYWPAGKPLPIGQARDF